MKRILYKRFIVVRDDFYANPSRVHELAEHAEYYEPEDAVGFRSRTIYHEPGVKQKLQQMLGIKIIHWGEVPERDNGVFYRTFSDEIPGIHYDEPYNDVTVLVYLTPNLPADCGTSLWRHKKTGLCDPPTANDARRLKLGLRQLRFTLAAESKKRSKWREIDRIGYKFNRMVAYPSGAYHSATKHYGNPTKNGRLFQAFRLGVDWNSLFTGNDPTGLGAERRDSEPAQDQETLPALDGCRKVKAISQQVI